MQSQIIHGKNTFGVIADALENENAELQKCLADVVRSVLEIRDLLDPDGNLSVKDAAKKLESEYWLSRGMAEYIVEIYGETCERSATGGELCHNTADCITEWCVPCAASAWLKQQKMLEAPIREHQNGALCDGDEPPQTLKPKQS